LFEQEHEYCRALGTFGYDNIMRWIVEANVTLEGERCAEAIKWEGSNRYLNLVGGSHAAFQELQQTVTQLNLDITNL
jgi:hypothetical protein